MPHCLRHAVHGPTRIAYCSTRRQNLRSLSSNLIFLASFSIFSSGRSQPEAIKPLNQGAYVLSSCSCRTCIYFSPPQASLNRSKVYIVLVPQFLTQQKSAHISGTSQRENPIQYQTTHEAKTFDNLHCLNYSTHHSSKHERASLLTISQKLQFQGYKTKFCSSHV